MTITFDDYQDAALQTLSSACDDLYLAAKLPVEAAEAAQLIIKQRYHNKPLSLAELKEELGDLLWYLATLAGWHNLRIADIAEANIAKLRDRHGSSYRQAHYQQELMQTPTGSGKSHLDLPILVKLADDILSKINPDQIGDAPINWADLHAVDALITVDDTGQAGYLLFVEEASPEGNGALIFYLESMLEQAGWTDVEVVCRW